MSNGESRIAIVGAGLIGRRHAEAIQMAPGVRLTGLADPSPEAEAFASSMGVPCFRDLDSLLAADLADGVILATPNQRHAEGALACIGAGLPVLVEKPLTSDLASARAVVAAADAAGIPLATGHHRRHNPLIARAKGLVDAGALGQIASVQGTTWFMKPEGYFQPDWRRRKGAGPVYLNLIHDIDLLQHFCGPVAQVHAMDSSAIRGFEVEDTAVLILRFASGVLGTFNTCDSAVAPWSWELTAHENRDYPATGQNCYWIAGTAGSMSLPDLQLWQNPGERSWWQPIGATRFPCDISDPLVRQAEQFGRTIRREEPPLVSGQDGLAALAVIEAVKESARTGRTVEVAA